MPLLKNRQHIFLPLINHGAFRVPSMGLSSGDILKRTLPYLTLFLFDQRNHTSLPSEYFVSYYSSQVYNEHGIIDDGSMVGVAIGEKQWFD